VNVICTTSAGYNGFATKRAVLMGFRSIRKSLGAGNSFSGDKLDANEAAVDGLQVLDEGEWVHPSLR